MLIENPESLQTWLTSYLEPLCDADPQALAQYVMALIGKDKPTKDLKHILSEQLEVFLQKETLPFVEVLFETIDNKSYLEPVNLDSHSGSLDESPSGLDGDDDLQSTVDNYGVQRNLGSPLQSLSPEYEPKSLQNLPDSSAPGSQLTSSAHKRSYHNRERSKSRSNSRSRSRSPPISSSLTRHRPRDIDMRRQGTYGLSNQGNVGSRGHFTDERNRRTGWNSPSSRGMSRRYGPSSTSSSSLTSSSHLGGGYRRNQQQVNRRSRSRSKSRTPSRSRSRSYSPQPSPSHERGRAKDKTRTSNRLHNRVQSTSRSRSRNRDGPVSKRTRVSSKSPVNEEAEEEKEEKSSFTKKRCRDYDERGFCMRGDLCQFDHGSDPMVLDGAVSSVVLGLTANGNPALAASQSIATAGSASFLNEPYNPEAPGIDKQIKPHGNRRGSGVGSLTVPLRGPVPTMGNNYNHIPQHQFWRPIAPPLRPLPPGSSSTSFIPSMNQSNRPRELVGVVTLSEGGKNSSLTLPKINPDLTKIMHKSTMDASTPSLTQTSSSVNLINSGSNSHHHSNSSLTMSKRGGNSGRGGGSGSGHRGGFRGGYIKRMVNNESADKCTLEVRKIPPNLNTIANLNSHFSKFGSIVNLQVCYDGDSEAALIQFASHNEALSAHRCTEAVLNNRFIKVFWHSKDQSQQSQQQQQQQQQQQSSSHSSTNQGPGHHHHSSTYDSSLRAANGSIMNDSNKSDQINSNSSRPNVKDRLGLRHTLDSDKNSASTNVPTGTISRTVFNPSLLKKQYPSSTNAVVAAASSSSSSTTIASAATTTTTTTTTATGTVSSNLSTTGLKQETGLASTNPVSESIVRRKEESKKDKLLKKLDLQKKRQNILVSCMQQQKRLIEKLQKAKTDKEKIELRSMVDLLNKQIKGLESDIKKDAEIILAEASKLPSSGKIKSKIQVEKELLDVEMDFYNELHKGATASELHKKLQELKIKAKPYCMNDIRSTKAMIKRFAEMKGALRDRNRQANHTLAKNFENLRKVDRRTRKIFVENIPEDDNGILLAHLSQSAEIESLESTPQGLLVTFRTRRDAEMALPLISTVKLKDQAPKLKASWFDEIKAKAEELEIAHSHDKVSSELESLIESDVNVNNDTSKINDDDESAVNPEKDGDLIEEETEEITEEKCSKEPQIEDDEEEQQEQVINEHVEEEEEDSSATEIDEDPRNQETDDDDDNQVSPKGDEGVEEGYVVEGKPNEKENEDTINEEEEEGPTTTNKKTLSPDELQLGVSIEDDLLEEEETDDEDESRAWRR